MAQGTNAISVGKRRLKELALQCWYSTPCHFWGTGGHLWQDWTLNRFSLQLYLWGWKHPGELPEPWGGMVESIFRRRRRCVVCEKYFWREGAFNPFAGVNIFEEVCSSECNEIDLSILPY